MMSAALQSGGVSLGQGQSHVHQSRRYSSMMLGSRTSSSATAAVSTLPSSSSLSSSTSTSTSSSSTCPHTQNRQDHNSSKLPTFRFADVSLQHRAPNGNGSSPNPAAVAVAVAVAPSSSTTPGSRQGPGSKRQGLPSSTASVNTPPTSDPHQNPLINRQSMLHMKHHQTETPAVAGAVAAAVAPSVSARTRASTFIPSVSVSTWTSTSTNNNGALSSPPSSTKTPTVKSTPTTTSCTTSTSARRPASLPISPSRSKHVSRPDNKQVSSATSPSAPTHAPAATVPSSAPTPTPASSITVSDSRTTTAAPPVTTSDSTQSTNPSPSATATATTKSSAFSRSLQSRRPPLSFSGQPSPSPSTVGTQRRHTFENQGNQASTDKSTKDWASGQRELILPKSLSSTPSDDKRFSVALSRRPPPVSYKAPPSLSTAPSPTTSSSASPTVTTPVRVPPIRGFRSSGSRRSLGVEPVSRPSQNPVDGSSDEAGDMSSREDTLRALEGRPSDYIGRPPLESARNNSGDHDDTTDMFLNIAREESIRPSIEDATSAGDHGTISRVIRSTHRRPLSAAIPSYQPPSPPRIGRRLSDQRDTSMSHDADEDASADQIRIPPYRSFAREKAASAHPAENVTRRATTSFRSGSTTPRSLAFQDAGDPSPYGKRRTSISDGVTPRTTPYKQTNHLAYGHYRSPVYHSSPLAPRAEPQQGAEYGHGREGTESTASTTGPSTVWDELDDLKSRINRMEFAGKLPATSGAAMSRVSDDRPYTANTTATNISSSPKRNTASVAPGQHADAGSVVAAGQQDSHPILHAALAKSKALLGSESYRALEAAATDSLALLSMMGTPGNPGPVSSAASTIGTPGVTDRQLRRKADSVCRSITELCLALNDEYSRPTTSHNPNTPQADNPTTPTLVNSFSHIAAQRRPSAIAEQDAPRVTTSPRAMTRLEERRSNMLNSSSLASPRLAAPPLAMQSLAPPSDAMQGRRSSLLIARRRAGTEEPDDGRRSSLLLRTRRAGTEEPEESSSSGRKPSLLIRTRRGTIGEDDEEAQFRAPSRATTEVRPTSSRAISRDYSAPGADPTSLTSSALPRRRLGASTTLSSRFAVPPSPAPISGRRFLDSNNTVAEKPAEERSERSVGSRLFSLGQAALSRRSNRDSTIVNTPGASQVGSYR